MAISPCKLGSAGCLLNNLTRFSGADFYGVDALSGAYQQKHALAAAFLYPLWLLNGKWVSFPFVSALQWQYPGHYKYQIFPENTALNVHAFHTSLREIHVKEQPWLLAGEDRLTGWPTFNFECHQHKKEHTAKLKKFQFTHHQSLKSVLFLYFYFINKLHFAAWNVVCYPTTINSKAKFFLRHCFDNIHMN